MTERKSKRLTGTKRRLLLGTSLIFSVLFFVLNANFWTLYQRKAISSSTLPLFSLGSLRSNVEPITSLIIVAGHAVTSLHEVEDAEKDEAWMLLDYQQKQGLGDAFVAHIKTGINIASQRRDSLLLFSGGQTRVSAGPKSEGFSYYSVADHYNFFGKNEVRSRTATEEYARDSFENLLFSICRFKEITGRYPEEIYLISFSFKRERFVDHHREALRFPDSNFHFAGVDPSPSKLRAHFNVEKLRGFEKSLALEPFKADPYGCYSEILKQKRVERDPFARTIPYKESCPQIKELLEWCGPNLFPGQLPWSK